MSCAERRELIAQLVVGGLEPGEHAELSAHLETGCPRCAASVAEAQKLALALSVSPDPVEPAPGAKRKLLARVDPAFSEAPHRPAAASRTRRRELVLAAGLSALAAGIVVAAFFTLQNGPIAAERNALAAQVDEVQSLQAELESELSELRSELALSDAEIMEVEAKLWEAEADISNFSKQIEMLSSSGTVAIPIRGTSRQPRAEGQVFWDDDYYCYLSAENLRVLEAGRVYALWIETENRGVVLAGSFGPDASGVGTLWVPLDRDLGRLTRAFVTDEEKDDIGQRPTGSIELESRDA